MTERQRALGGVLSAGVVLALFPALGMPAFFESFLYLIFHWVALATSWSLLSGYAGYFSFGHGAFFGAGMYATATLAGSAGVPFLWTLPLAGLVSAALGAAVGAVVFRVKRLRGELFGLLTLAVTFVLATIVLNTRIDGGPGVYLNNVPVPKLVASPTGTIYLLGLVLALAAVATAYLVAHSRFGLGLFAIHDDEDVAEVKGVPTFRAKLAALALSAGIAGVAGGIQAIYVGYVTVGETFSITVPLYVVLMSILGGARHWLGPAAGAIIITASLYAFTGGESAVLGRAVVALLLILVILLLPDGIVPAVLAWRPRSRAQAISAPGSPVVDNAAAPMRAPAVAPSSPASSGHMATDRPASADHRWAPQRPRVGGSPGVSSQSLPVAPLLECRDVWRAFGGIQALRGVNVAVPAGEIVGLVGPNGSGKTTLINVISGHYPLDRGTISLAGTGLAGCPAHQIATLGVSRTYQIPRPFAHLTALDNVALAAAFGPERATTAAARDEALHWLEFTGLAHRKAMLPGQLNLHERKFLELARALAGRPRLILLDEVLSGLNPGEIANAVALIRRIGERGATILFVEHVMQAVLELSSRVVVLNEGEVIADGDPREAMRDPLVVQVYLGKSHVA